MQHCIDMVALGLLVEEAIDGRPGRVRDGIGPWAADRQHGWAPVCLGCLVSARRGRWLLDGAQRESAWAGDVAAGLGPEACTLFSELLDADDPWDDSVGRLLLERSAAALPAARALRPDGQWQPPGSRSRRRSRSPRR